MHKSHYQLIGKEKHQRGIRRSYASRNRKHAFEPTSDYVAQATAEFINNGGTIKKIELSFSELAQYCNNVDREADNFLMGDL